MSYYELETYYESYFELETYLVTYFRSYYELESYLSRTMSWRRTWDVLWARDVLESYFELESYLCQSVGGIKAVLWDTVLQQDLQSTSRTIGQIRGCTLRSTCCLRLIHYLGRFIGDVMGWSRCQRSRWTRGRDMTLSGSRTRKTGDRRAVC